MRLYLIFTLFSLVFLSCNPSSEKKGQLATDSSSTELTPGKFFDYDEIKHYYNKNADYIFDDQFRSEIDSLKQGVIIGHIPKDMNDLFFLDKLEEIGYTKNSVDQSKFKEIDEIFSEKFPSEVFDSACIYIYRDILIFKKNNKVVGIAKICFECGGKEIIGTSANTHYFGQDGDYLKLEKLLR